MYIFLLHLYLLSTSLCLHYISFTLLITRLLKTLKFFAKEPRSQLELSRFDYFFLQQIATTLLIQPLKFQILKLCFLNPIGHFLPRPWFKFAGYLAPTSLPAPGPRVFQVRGGKTLFSQEVGAKLKRRVQGLRHSEFDLLQLCVCNCTRSPSGSATSVPPYKCTRFKDYFEFVIAINSSVLRSLRTFLQVYRFKD